MSKLYEYFYILQCAVSKGDQSDVVSSVSADKDTKTYPSHDLNGEVMEHGPHHHGHGVGVVPDKLPAAL